MANQLELDKVTFAVGDTVRVHQKIQEGDKTRIQPFEGIVISIKGKDENKMFTVRKIATGGIGVERIWPAFSPWIQKIEVKKKGEVRRAKLYYLRKKMGKKAVKVKAKKVVKKETTEIKKTKGKRKADKTKADEKAKPRPTRRRTSRKKTKKE